MEKKGRIGMEPAAMKESVAEKKRKAGAGPVAVRASVVIPAFNAGNVIGGCLRSLQQQSFQDFEVIVVDDGSSDRTVEVANGFAGVRVLRQQHAGPAVGRNRGAKAAKGEIVVFTDSDCVPDANWIREMVQPFEDSKVMAVKGAYRTRQNSLTARFAQLEFEERFGMLRKAETIDMVDTYSAGFRRKK